MTAPAADTQTEALVETVRKALMQHQPPVHDPPCETGSCAPHFALSVLAARLETAEEEALRFGGNAWRARAVAAERERDAAREEAEALERMGRSYNELWRKAEQVVKRYDAARAVLAGGDGQDG